MTVTLQAPSSLRGTITLPASKSITNRALLIAALCQGEPPQVLNAALCDDTDAMLRGLAATGGTVDVGPAGTAMRFLTAWFTTRQGVSVTLDGTPRMRQRPIAPLVEALRGLGADIRYVGSEGFPPLTIHGRQLHGGEVTMDGSVSSQFVSAVMMILPVVGGGTITLTGGIASRPYIDMTAAVMTRMGASVEIQDSRITVEAGGYEATDYVVEGDWSAAAVWYALAALVPHTQLKLQGLTTDSIQGDARLADLMRPLGVHTSDESDGVTIASHESAASCCCSAFMDMAATPDLIPQLVVLLCLMERSFRLSGTHTLRFKESDRLQALRQGLLQLGYVLHIEASGDAVSWYGDRIPLNSAQPPMIDACDDHRLAMAFVPAAIRFPGLVITDAQCVSKSYPALWQALRSAGFEVREA